MNRILRMVAALVAAALLSPSSAFAYENQMTPLAVHLAVSAAGLGVAIVLLIEALGLRKIFLGGAIADKIHFVILAIVCLAASALAKWTSNFVSGVTFEQTELVSEGLVVIAMGLLAAYFYAVRSAMQAYLTGMRSEQAVQSRSVVQDPEDDQGA